MHRWLRGVDIDVGRMHVAVMFADFVGLAGLVESIGAELAFRQVAPVIERLVAVVAANGGVVQHIVGGASMSVFGLRPTRGDEAAQAVSAGVALTSADSGACALPVHVGIECGEASTHSDSARGAHPGEGRDEHPRNRMDGSGDHLTLHGPRHHGCWVGRGCRSRHA